jgi:hypothetical protein
MSYWPESATGVAIAARARARGTKDLRNCIVEIEVWSSREGWRLFEMLFSGSLQPVFIQRIDGQLSPSFEQGVIGTVLKERGNVAFQNRSGKSCYSKVFSRVIRG